MASTTNDTGSPPPQRPRGILKNPSHISPPASPTPPAEPTSAKEVTIANTHYNAGNRRTPSTSSRPAAPRAQSAPDGAAPEPSQRLKWDEANLYLTEQERTPKMKIDEPKTPFARGYESPSDDEDAGEIPGLSLGEPEAKVPERRLSDGSRRAVLVEDGGGDSAGADSAEEKEKHRRFEEMRKRHYEMKGAVQLLGHTEELMEEEDDGEEGEERVPPPVPPIPQKFQKVNGS